MEDEQSEAQHSFLQKLKALKGTSIADDPQALQQYITGIKAEYNRARLERPEKARMERPEA